MSPTHPQMVQREMCVERGGTTSSETGAWASGHPCSCSVGVGPCHTKASTPAQKGPADPGAPRSHRRPCGAGGCSHTSMVLCSPRPLPLAGCLAQAPNRRMLGFPRPPHWAPRTAGGQCWLAIPLALPGSLGTCPKGARAASPWASASPQGFFKEPRHFLPLGTELSLGCLKLSLCCVDVSVLARMLGPAPEQAREGGWGHHGVGPGALNAAVQKLLGISGHY